jgi:hypothetical protein
VIFLFTFVKASDDLDNEFFPLPLNIENDLGFKALLNTEGIYEHVKIE